MVSSAARVGSINVLFSAQFEQAVAGTNRFASAIERGGSRAQRSVVAMDRSVLGLNRTMAGLDTRTFGTLSLAALRAGNSIQRLQGLLLAATSLAGGFSAALAIRGIQEYSDTWKNVGNRLRVAKDEASSLSDVQEQIFQIAQRSRSQYESTGILFARLNNSAKRLGVTQKDILRTTETIQKAFLVGGSTPEEAAGSAIQLSQGIASNRLGGDELRAVLENPALGQLLADQISGGDIGKLRQLSKEGKLTADVIIKAFLGASDAIDKLFATTDETIGQAFVKIDNAIQKYIGTSSGMNASSRASINVLEALAANIDTVADSLTILAGAGAAIFGARGIRGITGWVAGMRESAVVARDAAAAEAAFANEAAATAKTEWVQQRLAFNRALSEGTLTSKQLARQQKILTAATVTYRETAAAATVAQERLNIATKEARVGTLALSTAGRGLSAAWAFIGGPIGAAFLALGGIMYVASKNAAAAEERSDHYADAIEKAGKESKGAAGGIKAAAEAYFQIDKAATGAEQAVTRAAAKTRLQGALGSIDSIVGILRAKTSPIGTFGLLPSKAVREMADLSVQFDAGKISAEEFIAKLDEINETDPSLAPWIAQMQKSAREADAARGEMDALKKSIDGVTASSEKLGRVGASVPGPSDLGATTNLYRRMHPETFGNTSDKIADAIKSGFADLVGLTEGTDKGRGYNETLGYGRFTGGPVDLVNKTLDQVLELQRQMLANPDNKFHSSAVGRYQITRQTLIDLMGRLGLNGDEFFTKDMQDRLFNEIVRQSKGNPTALRGRWPSLTDRGISDGQIAAALDKTITDIPPLDPEVQKRIDALKDLKLDAATAQLSEFQQKMVATAKSAGATDDEIRQIIAAMLSGDFSKIPQNFKDIANALQQGFDARFLLQLEQLHTDNIVGMMSDLDQKTVATARSFGLAETQVKAFIEAARNGGTIPPQIAAIRDELEKTADNQKIADFADGVGSAFSNLGEDLFEGKNGLRDFGKEILRLIEHLLIIDPLVESLKNGIKGIGSGAGSLLGGGGGLFGGGGLLGLGGFLGFLHGGGDASGATFYRHVDFSAVPKAHKGEGLKHNEILRVLEDNETVLTGRNSSRIGDALAASTARLKDRDQKPTIISVNVEGANGDQHVIDLVQQGVQTGLSKYDKNLPNRINQYNERGI